jgi:rod shape-determining protein MreC
MQRRTFYLLIVLCLGHVLIISSQVQSKSGLPLLESVAFGSFARVQQILAGAADGVSSVWRNYFALWGVDRENQDLKRRVLELEGLLQNQQAAVDRTHALEELLGFKKSVPAPTLAARVIAGSPSPGSMTVTIDRGAADGVEPNMPVIASQGVVGRVIGRPALHAAQVQLLIGREAAAGALLERSGTGGLIEGGQAGNLLRLIFVQAFVDVQVGERVLTSGQDEIYPQGFVIGTVSRAERGGRDWVIDVRPAVDFSRIDVVLVVLRRSAGPIDSGGDR